MQTCTHCLIWEPDVDRIVHDADSYGTGQVRIGRWAPETRLPYAYLTLVALDNTSPRRITKYIASCTRIAIYRQACRLG